MRTEFIVRVAIVIPPIRDFYFTTQRASFLGPLTISRLLDAAGIEHRVFNAVRSRGRRIELPDELSYLRRYLGMPGFFKEYRRYGIEDEEMASRIADWRPDIVLISCFAFGYAADAISLSRAVRRVLPRTVQFAGGAGVSAYPEYFIRNGAVDYAVRGEVDASLVELIRYPDDFHAGDSVLTDLIMRLNGAPFAPVLTVIRESGDTMFFSTMITRGCPRRCSFCSVRLCFPEYRRTSLADVERMFSSIPRTRKKIHVNFEDDTLATDMDFLVAALDILDRCSGGNYSFSMENGVDFRTLNDDILKLLKRRNLSKLNISLVSADVRTALRCGRRYTRDEFIRVVHVSSSLGIPVTAYLICGLPGEGYDRINAGVDFLAQLSVLIGISIFYPVPGIEGFTDTGIFDKLSPLLCRGSSFHPWNDCTIEELVHTFMRVRALNMSKSSG